MKISRIGERFDYMDCPFFIGQIVFRFENDTILAGEISMIEDTGGGSIPIAYISDKLVQETPQIVQRT